MDWLDFFYATLAGLSLISLLYHGWVISSFFLSKEKIKNNIALHDALFKNKEFINVLAALALFVSLQAGTNLLLFWIPNDWLFSISGVQASYKSIMTLTFSASITLIVCKVLPQIAKTIDSYKIADAEGNRQ